MQKHYSLLQLACTLLLTSLTYFCHAQAAIDWPRDTVSATAATRGQSRYTSELSAAGKKATSLVSMPVNKLKEIIDRCAAASVSDIQFLIVMLRAEDTAHYNRYHPDLTAAQRADMVGRQTILLRVPRSAFGDLLGVVSPSYHPLLTSLLSSGLILLEHPYDGLPADTYLYFSTGTLCPPPNSCR